jgi:hypothetical protein
MSTVRRRQSICAITKLLNKPLPPMLLDLPADQPCTKGAHDGAERLPVENRYGRLVAIKNASKWRALGTETVPAID